MEIPPRFGKTGNIVETNAGGCQAKEVPEPWRFGSGECGYDGATEGDCVSNRHKVVLQDDSNLGPIGKKSRVGSEAKLCSHEQEVANHAKQVCPHQEVQTLQNVSKEIKNDHGQIDTGYHPKAGFLRLGSVTGANGTTIGTGGSVGKPD